MLIQPTEPDWSTQLQFTDAAGCAAWLESIAVQPPAEAHQVVTAQIALVGSCQQSALERLRMLEVLHQGARFVHEELAGRYVGRALPLSSVEQGHWHSALALWRALSGAYTPLLRDSRAGEPALTAHAPLLALRSIEFAAGAIEEHHRVYREVPAALWQQLHAAYAFAERQGLAAAGVADPLVVAISARTPAAVYGRSLLAHLSNPYTMSPRQMSVMYRWTQLWEPLVAVSRSAAAPGMGAALAVDLTSGAPALPAGRVPPGESVRYLSLQQLGQALRRVLALLRQGEEPAALGLGEDLRQPGCERLLTLLYLQWCGSGTEAPPAVRDRDAEARATVGFEAVCRLLACEYAAAGAEPAPAAAADQAEHWFVAEAAAPGFVTVARGPECNERIQHHQLVAIRRRSAAHFQLAVAQWLRLEQDGGLSIGLRLLPGIAHLTRARPDGAVPAEHEPGAAILLPAAPEARTPATLVLAPNTFQAGRQLVLSSGSPRRVTMLRLLEHGADFERVVFEIAD